MIKKGTWIIDKRGTYAVVDIEDGIVIIRDVLMDKRGAVVYGRKRTIRSQDLKAYTIV